MRKLHLKSSFIFFLILVIATPTFANTHNYGAQGALNDSKISLAKALTYALEDEYLALSRYKTVIQKFGNTPPFKQVKTAEQNHIKTLLPLFKKYNIEVPKDTTKEYVSVPKTLNEAFKESMKDELANIRMYNKLTSIKEFPDDILIAFQFLANESKEHYLALKKDKNHL